jgi:integrase
MALHKQGGMTSLALEFMLLTACRTGEVAAARWDEVDFSTNIWTVPAVRMKAGNEHRVPLCSRAVEILRVLKAQAQNEFVFPSHAIEKNSHMSLGSCLVAMKRMDGFAGYTPHVPHFATGRQRQPTSQMKH